MTVSIQPTRYEVSELPLGHHERHTFSITVEYTGSLDPDNDRVWAVRRMSRCLSVSGEWVWEPQPSSRDSGFFAKHRFTLEEATRLAVEEVPKIVVNGWTARAVQEREVSP